MSLDEEDLLALIDDLSVKVIYIVEEIIVEATERVRTAPPEPEPPPVVEPEPLEVLPKEEAPVPVLIRRRGGNPVKRADWQTWPNKRALTLGESAYRDRTARTLDQYQRPKTRGECIDAPRPCPWVACRQHLAINVTVNGTLQLINNWDDGRATCALDMADDGSMILDILGRLFGVTRERARQIELHSLMALKSRLGELDIDSADLPDSPEHHLLEAAVLCG